MARMREKFLNEVQNEVLEANDYKQALDLVTSCIRDIEEEQEVTLTFEQFVQQYGIQRVREFLKKQEDAMRRALTPQAQ
eukprot:m.21301 g.21301  ORF g.21301 m.21301 type:complete len:79 (+) comp8271_c0_seq3:206-442(+)